MKRSSLRSKKIPPLFLVLLLIVLACIYFIIIKLPLQKTPILTEPSPSQSSSNNMTTYQINDFGLSFEYYKGIEIVEKGDGFLTFGRAVENPVKYTMKLFTISDSSNNLINMSDYKECEYDSNLSVLFKPCIVWSENYNDPKNYFTSVDGKNANIFMLVRGQGDATFVVQTLQVPLIQVTSNSTMTFESFKALISTIKFTE